MSTRTLTRFPDPTFFRSEGALDLLVRHIVHIPRGLADQQAEHFGLRRELDERELDRLILRERLAERFALPRVFHALFDAIDRGTQRRGRLADRSEGRRVGKEGVRTWRSRWSPYP